MFYGTPETAVMLNQTIKKINDTLKPDNTLLVIPEGIIINYLTRKTDPMRETEITPPAFEMWGKKVLLQHFINAKPDYVLFVNRDTSEFGLPQFGNDYGQAIMKKLISKYQPIWLLGTNPDPEKNFIFILLKRKRSKA